ncbi:hypothetical protein H4R18_003112 [Coemansia javaensis]|uniref:Late embryogenesis abundant protein LEA-2 subgroup domain-containing protein n=1 Tax=Coemansia javaensis TaxID=2761396 RepID=A0A9W8HGE3_9FUNG|nr:hypothetical protein H4R18_003112 [Coemansia javaensis]
MPPASSRHGSYHRSGGLHVRPSIDWDPDRPGSRFSAYRRPLERSMHHVPPVHHSSRIPNHSVVSHAPSTATRPHWKYQDAAGSGEKRPPPYGAGTYSEIFEGGNDDSELVATERARRVRRIAKYVACGVACALAVLACALTGYFLAPRAAGIALHAISSTPPVGAERFKLHGTRLQFHVDLVYRVQNDNYFDMTVDDISAAVFWPETKFALGGGRLSGISVPARRTAEVVMPVAIRYDVKRGPPAVLLGLVDSCGLHDAGIGEISLEAEMQADFHTKMARASTQSARQTISIKCPVRRMATLQVDDGSSGTLGDIYSYIYLSTSTTT